MNATAQASTNTGHGLYLQVVLAIALGVAVGHFFPATGEALKPLGDAFVKGVRMIIGPVVFLSLTTGIAAAREHGLVGRLAARTLGYFLVVSSLALVIGLVVANCVRPGAGLHIDPATLDATKVSAYVAKAHEAGIVDFLLAIIPDSLLGALTATELLPILLVSLLAGIAMAQAGVAAAPLLAVLQSAREVVFRIVALLMQLAPVGAFGAMAFTIGKYGLHSLANLAGLVATFYLTSAAFVAVVLGAIARLAGFNIIALLRYLKSELMLVLGTSSSEAALPSLMEKLERAGCRKSVVSLVVPTGYSFNLDGTNLYMTLAALFIAQAIDVPLTWSQQWLLLGVAIISSKGAAGVTGAGFITLAATLSIVPDVPVAGMALILGIDRFMSECRALTNFIGNAVATIVVAGWEGALDRDQLHAALRN